MTLDMHNYVLDMSNIRLDIYIRSWHDIMTLDACVCDALQKRCRSTDFVATSCPTRIRRCSWIDSTSTRIWISHSLTTTSIPHIIRTWRADSLAGSRRLKCTDKFFFPDAGSCSRCIVFVVVEALTALCNVFFIYIQRQLYYQWYQVHNRRFSNCPTCPTRIV